MYYHPLKGYEGVDAFDYSVRLGTYESKAATVGVHVRKCRKFEFNKKNRPPFATSPLCACVSNLTWAFGHATECPAAVRDVCADVRMRSSFTPLCDACAFGFGMDTTSCRLHVDRAATTVEGLGLCGHGLLGLLGELSVCGARERSSCSARCEALRRRLESSSEHEYAASRWLK